jgi:hypothetical protein
MRKPRQQWGSALTMISWLLTSRRSSKSETLVPVCGRDNTCPGEPVMAPFSESGHRSQSTHDMPGRWVYGSGLGQSSCEKSTAILKPRKALQWIEALHIPIELLRVPFQRILLYACLTQRCWTIFSRQRASSQTEAASTPTESTPVKSHRAWLAMKLQDRPSVSLHST